MSILIRNAFGCYLRGTMQSPEWVKKERHAQPYLEREVAAMIIEWPYIRTCRFVHSDRLPLIEGSYGYNPNPYDTKKWVIVILVLVILYLLLLLIPNPRND